MCPTRRKDVSRARSDARGARVGRTMASAFLAVVGALGVAIWSVANATIINFSATIDGGQESPPCSSSGAVPSTGTGSGTFVMDTCANTLDFNITFSGLTCGAELFSHIHGPAPAGMNAPVLFQLPNGSPKIGQWSFPEANEADILGELTYVNVHGTDCCTAGEIRGQILQDPGQPTPGPCPTPTLDHFTCYKAVATKGSVKFPGIPIPPGVFLEDQFRQSVVAVKKPTRLCNPTQKNAEPPPANPDEHLKAYQVKPAVKFVKVLNQSVTDQFGTRRVDVLKPIELMLPTAKELGGPPPPPLAAPVTRHFQCYKVKDLKFPAKFQPIQVLIEDQFGTLALELKKPVKLCAPADKYGEDPSAPDAPEHLFCYKVKDLKLPKFVAVSGLSVNNQFGPERLDAKKPMELCVPALKNVPPVPTPTPTPPPGGTIFQGSLSRTTGAWNYGGVNGQPGGELECGSRFPGSHLCTFDELEAAEALGELAGATDVDGLTVNSFWAVIPGAIDNHQCISAPPGTPVRWYYATAHTASRGVFATLNNATGELGSVSSPIHCIAGNHWVGCCKTP
jgi:hypothetical protein